MQQLQDKIVKLTLEISQHEAKMKESSESHDQTLGSELEKSKAELKAKLEALEIELKNKHDKHVEAICKKYDDSSMNMTVELNLKIEEIKKVNLV